jgi:N-acetyltransferase 10
MGYGSRALDLLIAFYSGELGGGSMEYGVFNKEGLDGQEEEDFASSDLHGETISQKSKLPPLLIPLAERRAETLDWLGVSFGITPQLFNFWSRKSFRMCYLRQSVNDLTGEHSTVMLRELQGAGGRGDVSSGWLDSFVQDYRARMLSLLAYSFRSLRTSLALSLVDPQQTLTALAASNTADEEEGVAVAVPQGGTAEGSSGALMGRELVSAQELTSVHLSHHDMKRLELYSRNMVDHHMIMDTVPIIARLFFLGRLPPSVRLSNLQAAILLAVGLQHKDVDELCSELNLPINQVLAFFNKTIRRLSSALRELLETEISAQMAAKSSKSQAAMEKRASAMTPSAQSLQQDQQADETDFLEKQRQQLLMQHKDLAKHSLGGVDGDLLVSAMERSMKKNAGNAIPKSISIPKAVSKGEAEAAEEKSKRKKHSHQESGGDKGGKKKKARKGEH